MKSGKIALHLSIVLTAVISFFIYVFIIDPSLHHHYQQIAWQNNYLFLRYYLAFAGGPGEYIALFISQFFFSKLLGSAIIAFAGYLISFFIFKTVSLNTGKLNIHFLMIPLLQIIVVTLMFDYRFHFAVIFNLTIVSGLLYACSVIGIKFRKVISYQTLIAGLIIYYVSGGMYFLIFMLSSLLLLFEKPDRKLVVNAVLIIIESLLVPLIAFHFVFLSSLNSSFFRATPDVATMLRYSRPPVFYVALAAIPAVILLVRSFELIPVKRNDKIAVSKKKTSEIKEKTKSRLTETALLIPGIQIIILLFVSGFVLFYEYKPEQKARIKIDYYASRQEWDKVLSEIEKTGSYDRMVNFQYNRALMNQGRLLDKIFNYEQLLGSLGLFVDKPFNSEVALPCSDLYFDLGNIDESQRYAFESQTLMTNSPRVLKRLILNCLIMNKPEAANTYINVLAANPLENKWVQKYRKLIDNPNLAASDQLVAAKRDEMSKTEGMIGTPPVKLLDQLEKNPKNKAAFEYLIAFDLLEHDLHSLTDDFKFIEQLNYQKLPVALEEAIILFKSQGKTSGILNTVKVSESTTERFREFAKLTSASKGDRERAKLATAAFKNTYWYYVLFLSPKVTNLKLETRPVDANY